jgi:TRAP-type C4-dicarboxylate transport system permease large subunit
MATVAATAGFSAICGSTSATAAAMGKVSIPEMKRYGYDESLATGCIAAAGGLGILIPPSTIFIIYGILVQEAIGKLFISGVIPGIILAGIFFTVIYIMCRFRPSFAARSERVLPGSKKWPG